MDELNQYFENYIVSDCNKVAYETGLAFLEEPFGKFIALFGPSASGKTFLISKVMNAYQMMHPGAKVRSSSFDEIITDYIEVLQSDNKNEDYSLFRNELLACDLLIIDNMQFIGGRSYTQEEFSRWFINMLQNNKNVILAFDRPASCFENMFTYMMARSPNCFMVDIEEPDVNFREKFLNNLLAKMGVDIPPSIKNILKYSRNVPFYSFYGYLSKLQFLEKIVKRPLKCEEMLECLSDYRHTSIQEI